MPESPRRVTARKPTKARALPEVPEFASDEEEAAWLESPEGRRYMARAPLVPIRFVLAEPHLVPVTIRLPAELRTRIRRLAEARCMGYQTLARQWLLERCAEEEAKAQRPAAERKPKRARSQKSDQAVNNAAG